MKHIKKHQYTEQSGPVAQPRIVPVFTQSLSAKHMPSPLGMRPGSNDHLAWKSKHV